MRLGILGGGRAAWAFGSAWKRIGWPLSGVWLRDESHSHIAELLETSRLDLADLAARIGAAARRRQRPRDPEVRRRDPGDRGARLPCERRAALRARRILAASAQVAAAGRTAVAISKERCSFSKESTTHREAHRRRGRRAFRGARAGAEVAVPRRGGVRIELRRGVARHRAAADGRASASRTSREDLVALALSAIENWRSHTDAKRFTGPAARGDEAVLRAHVDALRDDPQLAEIYELLARELAGSLVARQK